MTCFALSNSLPQPASGVQVDALKVFACHREACRLAGVPADDPMRQVLSEPDPLKRALRASRIAALTAVSFSSVVADALTSLPPGGRQALAAHLFEFGSAGNLVAAIAEQCAELYLAVCTAQDVHESVPARSARYEVWKRIEALIGPYRRWRNDPVVLPRFVIPRPTKRLDSVDGWQIPRLWAARRVRRGIGG